MGESFVVDNSIVMSWCFKDEENQYADAVLDRLSEGTAFVPSIWPLEVVNALLAAEPKKRLNEADSVRFITLLSQLPIMVEHERPERSSHSHLRCPAERGCKKDRGSDSCGLVQ